MSIAKVKLKHNLLEVHSLAQIKNLIMTKLQEIPDFQNLKLDVELTLHVCNVIENGVKEYKLGKIDKAGFVVDVLTALFNLTDAEKAQILSQIQFLYVNGKIKAINVVKLIGSDVYSWVKKKIL
jgi:hypothetical protein